MKLNYKMVTTGVNPDHMLALLNEALELAEYKEPTPQQVEVCLASVALAAKVHAARKGNMLFFWPLELGERFPFPDTVNYLKTQGAEDK